MKDIITMTHFTNPALLKEVVGFKVATFYHSGNNDEWVIFWEEKDPIMIGKTKRLKAEKIGKEILQRISDIRKEL